MRAGLSTIQQTLTPEAASILTQSIAEAGRRNHSQTTPLHVASTLLAPPNGYLRQACIRSHPTSSHPLQCRALELCFSVALDRLPSAQNASSSAPPHEPAISNALMAALKRAQAHQRRGCPEQQQQPLLAVKVELEQLIVSILDDPGVSRVMREASFSSPAVKLTIEQALNSSPNSVNSVNSISPSPGIGLGFRNSSSSNRNLYMNPRLQQGNLNSNPNSGQSGQGRKEELKMVIETLLRNKKKNPVLVGDTEPQFVVREFLQKLEKREISEAAFRNVQIISLDKEFGSDRSQIPMKFKELEGLIESRMSSGGAGCGVILDMGDLKWLVEQPGGYGGMCSGQQITSETGKVAVAEMGKLVARFGEGNGQLWLIGTATCETYLRCQVYHPAMENEWDLHALPVAPKKPGPALFPRMGGNGILSSSVESLNNPLKGFPTAGTNFLRRPSENLDPGTNFLRRPSENLDPDRRTRLCSQCTESYQEELTKLLAKEPEKSLDTKQEATRQPLPQWLQIAKPDNGNVKITDQSLNKDHEVMIKQKTEELQRKWNSACVFLHPRYHQNLSSERTVPSSLSMTSLYNSNPPGRQAFQPKLQLTKTLGGTLQMNPTPVPQPPPERTLTPPGSPVRTDLVLGVPNTTENTQREELGRDLTVGILSEPQEKFSESNREKAASILDPDSFKNLLKGLTDKVPWQSEAASAVAANVVQSRSGNGRRQVFAWKGDTWLLLAGPDRVGKKKMASALSELVCKTTPVTIHLGSRGNDDEEVDVTFRGKTTVDRIAEAVRRNPSAVIVLEDIDQADMLLHGIIKRAIERGRLPDSHGREVNLKNVIFILTADGLPENLQDTSGLVTTQEEKFANLARKGWQLELSLGAKCVKRRPDWLLHNGNRATKSRTEPGSGISFDLNEEAATEDDTAEGSRNSSDLTFEQDHEHGPMPKQSRATPLSHELLSSVDEVIVFKPVDFGPVKSKVASTIVSKFSTIVNGGRMIEVDKETLEQIVSGIWFGRTELEDWVEKVLVPSFHKLKNALNTIENKNTVRLVLVADPERQSSEAWLPNKVTVAVADGF